MVGQLLMFVACSGDTPAPSAPGVPSPETGEHTPETGSPALDTGGDTSEPTSDAVQLSPVDHLTRAAMALNGIRPAPEDLLRVQEDPSQLADIVAGYVESPLFGASVMDIENQTLLMRSEETRISDGPASSQELEKALFEEPLYLIQHVVMSDRPYTDIVTTEETVTTIYGTYLWAGMADDFDPDGDTWQPTTYTDGRPAAGVLSTSGWNRRFASNRANAHREGAAAAAQSLLCTDYLSRDIPLDVVDHSDKDAIYDAILTNDACVSCHQTLDPLAGFFWGFALRSAVNDDLPVSDWEPENVGLGEQATGRANGYFGLGGDTLEDLGQLIAADTRFSACTARRYISYLSQIPLEEVPLERVAAIQSVLISSGMSIKQMALAIVLSDDFAISHSRDDEGAERVVGMLKTRPTQMSRMMADLIGFTWQAEVGSDEPPHVATLLTDSQHGFLVIWGGIDSVNKIVPDYGYSATSSAALRNLAAESAGHVVAADLALDAEQRALLRFVEPDTTDEDDLRSQLVYLHQRILAELVEADSATIDDSLALYSDALKLTNDPATTWKIVLTALFQDFRVAYH